MSIDKEKEHDRLVMKLEGLLWRSGQYNAIQLYMPFYEVRNGRKEARGEIDLLAISSSNFDIYEVKGSIERSSISRGVEQLRIARLYFPQPGNSYIYTPQYGIESLDLLVQKLNHKMKHKQKR